MYLKRLKTRDSDDNWIIVGVCSDRGDCPVDDFLSGLDANLNKDVERVRALFRLVAKQGPNYLPVEVSHTLAADIFEFIRGRLRITWFYGEGGRIVVCCHGFIKKRQKTPRAEIQRAKKTRDDYFTACRAGTVSLIDEDS